MSCESLSDHVVSNFPISCLLFHPRKTLDTHILHYNVLQSSHSTSSFNYLSGSLDPRVNTLANYPEVSSINYKRLQIAAMHAESSTSRLQLSLPVDSLPELILSLIMKYGDMLERICIAVSVCVSNTSTNPQSMTPCFTILITLSF